MNGRRLIRLVCIGLCNEFLFLRQRCFWGVGCLIVLGVAALGQASPKSQPQLVDVELTLKAPDASLLRDTSIEISTTEQYRFSPSEQKVKVRTDAQGHAEFQYPAGTYRLTVAARGIGYGQSGLIDLVPGHVASLQLPPLIAYGTLDGTVPVSTCSHDVTVRAAASYSAPLFTTADAKGHFHFDDVEAGDWYLVAYINAFENTCAEATSNVFLKAGESLGGITVPAKTYPPTATPRAQSDSSAHLKNKTALPKSHPVVLLRGTVTDDSGSPVAGATVFTSFTFSGSIRFYGATTKTTTDDYGHYEVVGSGESQIVGTSVVATVANHPPAWGWPTVGGDPSRETVSRDPEPVTQNLVVSSKSGSLKVTALKDGKPTSGVRVTAYLEGADVRDIWAWGGESGDDREKVEAIIHPTRTTGSEGTAEFDGLLPGVYRISAEAPASKGTGNAAPLGVEVAGIPVSVGNTTAHTLQLYSKSKEVSFRVLREDGAPREGHIPFQFGPVDTVQRMSSVSLDRAGNGEIRVEHDGLWKFRFVHKDNNSSGGVGTSDFREPFYLAEGILAASPNLPTTVPPTLHSHLVDAPSVRVQLRDAKGKPFLGNIKVVGKFGEVYGSGTTDADGEIVFKGLQANQEYTALLVGSELTKTSPLTLDSSSSTLPPPEQLSPPHPIMSKSFVAASGQEGRVILRPEPMGYIYGVLRRGDDRQRHDSGIFLSPQQQETAYGVGAKTLYLKNADTGEFVVGPFKPGPTKLTISWVDNGEIRLFAVPVEVLPDRPTYLDIDATKYLPSAIKSTSVFSLPDSSTAGPADSFLGMGGISTHATGAQNFVGRVFLADGVTPALGAHVLYFEAGSRRPALLAITDALGNMQPRGLWSGSQIPPSQEVLSAPVTVAYLPGSCGATVQNGPIPRDQPIRLVLPSPVSARGTVTVAGENLLKRPGVVRIVAAYQGKGALDAAFSLTTTAEANGKFTLSGLTPGDYLVQAALDDIWLSGVVKLHVSETMAKPIHLTIPPPSVPVIVRLRDTSGNPLVGRSIRLNRSGPFSFLWPREWTSDGAGQIQIPTIEAGRHSIHVAGISKAFMVPAKSDGAKPIVVNMTLGR